MLRYILAFVIALLVATPVYANCMQSFKVKPDKMVTYFGWLPGSNEYNVGVMSCRALEHTRQQLFLQSGNAIDPKIFSSVGRYKTEVEETRKTIEQTEQKLRTQLAKDESINALRVTFNVLAYTFGKYSAIVGCYTAIEPPSMAACAIGIAILAKETASVYDGSIAKTEISERAKRLNGQLTEFKKRYADLLKNESSFNMSLAEKRYNEMFAGMCAAIQKECL